MPCDPAVLSEIKLFEVLSPKDRNALAGLVGYQQLPAGTTLFNAGEPGARARRRDRRTALAPADRQAPDPEEPA